MARGMIDNGDHQRLRTVVIRFYYLGHAPKRSGKVCGAYVKSVGELERVMMSIDQAQKAFVVVVARPVWEQLGENGRRALLDHELRHIGFNAAGAPALVPHDLQEFAATVRTYGIDWSEDVKRFAEAVRPHIKQLSLQLETGGADVGNGHLEQAA